ncbi:halocarboxylic acid dehydrogenase DehI family protein [Natronorubrum texcoconense]|uniref:Halocarboxylic acid dehydrogenase DehI n=1 Tax=Natronorubrum texcoconense TaxID=1095776 RepID=A0A1G9EWA4_9EURY|nr:halocarboxylic acid dehydrogenase DehI family protein [Natronorubrum texcoconense]SDK80452.1 Halocarboxylic acid dehydrogenase DehI [Natronorubrum texcoconense]
MDTSKQLYEIEATGWKRGLYDDIKRTFRAPIVNWIFRTTIANYPEFCRYAWAQVKPVFETARFGRLSVAYRDTVLSALEAESTVPTYRCGELDVSPAEYGELRGQLATYDIVAPRLAVLFELVDRGLHEEPVGTDPDSTREATSPLPPWLDADRGRPPTMIAFDETPAELDDVVTAIQSFHGLEDGLPSIYRTLAQWPDYLAPMWDDVEPILAGDAFSTAVDDARAVVSEFVDEAAYVPQLGPESLAERGIDEEAISELQTLFRDFNRGPIETVIPALPVYAATVDATGRRAYD